MYFKLNVININDGFIVCRKHKESKLSISYSNSLKPFKNKAMSVHMSFAACLDFIVLKNPTFWKT